MTITMQSVQSHQIEAIGHDDFCIATLEDGRLVAYGWGMDDFAPEDRDDLAEIARHLCLDAAERTR